MSEPPKKRHCIGCGWDALSSDVLVRLLSYVPSVTDFFSATIVNKATLAVVKHETERGLDGIRLSYLNRPSEKTNRFGRLIEKDVDPDRVRTFLEECVSASQMVVLDHMFRYNRSHPSGPQFVVAGGSMLHYWRFIVKGENLSSGPYGSIVDFGDVDIFVMENGNDRRESDVALEKVLLAAGEDIDMKEKQGDAATAIGEYEYAVLRNSGTLTMVSSDKQRPLQVVLRRISCVEELLCFFDLDCCRFGYSGGSTLYTTVEGIRAVELKRNFVSKEHVENSMYCRRAIKYGYRGFDTGFGIIHPFSHLFGAETAVFHDDEYEHSEAISSDRSDYVDEGLYTSFVNASLEDLNALFWAEAEDEGNDDEDDDEFQDVDGELVLKHRGNRQQLKTEMEESGFASSFALHFECMRSEMFIHIYYQSHLKHKYGIARCYITGQWFKEQPGKSLEFSSEGRAINEKGASAKRDLTGMVAVVTGARVRIGFATALELLRQGATVIATTRFAADAERRYSMQEDYHLFCDRLSVFPLNLQCVEDVQSFVSFVASKHGRVHVLVNNAAQTVRLPLRCYTNLIRFEYRALGEALGIENALEEVIEDGGESMVVSGAPNADPKALSVLESTVGITVPEGRGHLYSPPAAVLNALKELSSLESLATNERHRIAALRCMFRNLHPDDLRDFPDGVVPSNPMKADRNDDSSNSWKLEPTEVHPVELFETQTINHLAPTMLLNGLVPCLTPRPSDTCRGPSYVVNVTSIEGQFSVDVKESRHIHTNMSKAALNMLTKSGAHFYAKKGILVNSVDTGWVSSTIPTWKKPPLTKRDAAMRILNPILTKSTASGKLYKNYRVVSW